jgi:hypothetical protein
MPVGRHQVAAAQLDRVHPELARERVHRPLDHPGAVRAARAAVGAHRRGGGHHAAEAQVEARDDVGAHRVDHRVLRQVEAGDGVGAHLVKEIVAEREQRTLAGGRDRHVVHLVALHAGHQGVLPPRLDPLDRPAEPTGQLGHHDVLGVVHALGAEAAAHVRRGDHPHPILGQPELPGDHPSMPVDHLHRPADRQRLVAPLGDERARLEGMRAPARQADARAHHHRRGAERRLHVAHALAPLRDHVAADLLVEDGGAGGQRGLDVHHRGQRLVLDADQIERVVGAVDVVGDHRRHRLPNEAHAAGRERTDLAGHRQRGVGGVDRHRPADRAEVGRHEDAHHAGRAPRGRHVDRSDARVRVRRAQHRGVQAPRHGQIVDERSRPGDQPRILPPPHHPRVLSHRFVRGQVLHSDISARATGTGRAKNVGM